MSEKYLQFPLALLAYGSTASQRLLAIEAYSARHVGRSFDSEADVPVNEDKIERYLQKYKPDDWDLVCDDPEANYLILGFSHFKWFDPRFQNFGPILGGLRNVDNFLTDFENRIGKSLLVRIKEDLFLAVLWDEISTRDFYVLCAIYSLIGGNEHPVRITRDRIRAAAMGYSSNKIIFFPAENPNAGAVTASGRKILLGREDQALPLTTDQIRTTLDKLEGKSFFARCVVDRRHVYFSHRNTRDQIGKWILSRVNKDGCNLVAENRAADLKLQQQIDAIRLAKTAKSRLKPVGNL